MCCTVYIAFERCDWDAGHRYIIPCPCTCNSPPDSPNGINTRYFADIKCYCPQCVDIPDLNKVIRALTVQQPADRQAFVEVGHRIWAVAASLMEQVRVAPRRNRDGSVEQQQQQQ